MITTADQTNSYVLHYERRRGRMPGCQCAWLQALREQAMARFKALGFPTTKDESWRYTNVAPIRDGAFIWPQDGRQVLPTQVEALGLRDLGGACLVFINGRYAPSLSTAAEFADGVTVSNLAEVFDHNPDAIRPHLARQADYEDNTFTALNTALMEDGAVVLVPPGQVLQQPIHLLSITTTDSGRVMTHPRNLIVVGAQSQVSIVESYFSLGQDVHFTNAVTEAFVGEGAHFTHCFIGQENQAALNVSTLHTRQQRDSHVASHTFLLGGALVRNNIHPVLAGTGAQCLINGLFLGHGTQHMDNHMRIEHAAAHCDSRQFYKGILDDHAHGVFTGRIVVHPDAQKTDAKQSNMNLLLADSARVDTMPQLEIYADDVKCTHGATVGQIDENAVFYLQTRGIDEAAARNILIFAFAAESLERLDLQPVREHLETQIRKRLGGGAAVAKAFER